MPRLPAPSPFDRPRWSVDDAQEVMAALERSGQSVSVFAAEHGLDPQRVYGWRRRIGARAERTMRISRHRERQDRRMVNARIGAS